MSANPSRRTPLRLAAPLLVAALGGPGCGGDDAPGPAGPGGVASTVDVGGSSTVFRISDLAREEYLKVNKDVNVIVNNYGTGGGFNRYLNNELDVIDASRPATAEEELKAKTQSIDWSTYVVGYDGIAVVVHKSNAFVKELTVAQLRRIFEPNSKVKTWKDLDPAWPAKAIVIYTPDKESGTFEFFTEAIVGKKGAQRDDVQASSDDNTLVKGVQSDEDGIGYFGYAYYALNASGLRAIPVKATADAPAIGPDPETILKKTYTPLARPLYIYVKKSSMRRKAVADFVGYYIEHLDDLTRRAGYVPPTPEDASRNKDALSAARAPSA